MSAQIYSRNMPDTCTYWSPGTNDGLGGITWGSPVHIECRWQDSNELFKDDQGREFVAKAVIYIASADVEVEGKLALGHHAGNPSSGVQDIKVVYKTKTLDGRMMLVKAVL